MRKPKYTKNVDLLLIERNSCNNNVACCQLYQGPLCVAKGTSLHGRERAIENAYRNYKRAHKPSPGV